MHRDEAGSILATLREVHGRIASAMFSVDGHPALAFLRSTASAGRTRAVAAAAKIEVDALWTDFNALGELLDGVGAASGRRVGDREAAALSKAGALAGRLEPRTAALLAQLQDVDRAWSACGSALAPLADALSGLAGLAAGLGEPDPAATLRARENALRDTLLGDPLACAPSGVLGEIHRDEISNLAADLASTSERLTEQVALRDAYPARVAALKAQIEVVRTEEAQTLRACLRASEKISSPGFPPIPSSADVLRARVIDLDGARARKRWTRLAEEVATVEAGIARALARAAQLREAADGLVARRDELRGRLEAYRAKAARHKLDENDELAVLYKTAHTLLYTAPCDLPDATRAVFAYQSALTTLIEGPISRKEPR